jgi:hypothetical protein
MTVTADRPTYQRTRKHGRQTDAPTLALIEHAAKVVDDLAAHRPVYVSVDGEGGGWCVTAVDPFATTYTVWRDGRSLTVPWATVRDQ